MTYCYECGSEIKEGDAFCPYCGAAVKSAAEAGAVKTVEPQNNLTENQIAPASAQDKTSDSFLVSGKDAQVSDALETDLRKSAEADALGNPIVEQNDLNSAVIAPDDNKILLDASKDNQTESSLQSYTEVAPLEGAAVEQINETVFNETAFDESGAQKIADDEGEEETIVKQFPHIPPAAAVDVKRESGAQDADGETYFQKEFDGKEPDKKQRIFGNEPAPHDENAGAQPIEKPAVELENPESQSMQPRFDSVRIMETPKKVENSDAAAAEEPNNLAALAQPNSAAETTISENAAQSKGRSYTTPNIGASTDGKKSAKLKPLDEGTVLNDRYEIVRKIGGGGMGAVYLASDKNLGGVLRAVKEMVQSYIEDAQQEKAINDFKRESMLLTSLEHQSIPTIYDYFFDEGEARFYLVMKYISGGDLALRLRAAPEGRLDEQSVTEWAIQIADVLDYLHNRQPPIVYRDLKPANIMIDGNSGRAMLIDFGIARWINKEEKGVTAVGTMGYAPPELFSGNVEPRSDIYSLGSTMFHLLTGADPQSNPLLIFDFEKHPRPRQINPQLSDQIEKILMRCVEYNADKRFSSARELRETLEKHLENLKTKQVTHGVREVPVAIGLSQQTVFCGFCGRNIVASDMFCAFCGAKQPLAKQGVHSENYRSTSQNVTAQLLIVGTNDLETPAFTIEKDESLLGRRDPMSNIFPEVDLSRFDPQAKISRRHARIRREGGSFVVEDLGSSNGTTVESTVNEKFRLLPRQPYTLTNGDKLKLGDTTLHFIIS